MIEHFLNAVGASQPPERYGESFGAAKGNTAGGLLADSRSLVKGEGLRIATWARPPRLTLGAALLAYHYPLPQVVAKQSAGNDCASDCLGDRWGSLGAIRALCCRTA